MPTENGNHEVWVNDTLALGLSYSLGEIFLYRLHFDRKKLTFIMMEPWENSTWSEKILYLKEKEFATKLLNPIKKK